MENCDESFAEVVDKWEKDKPVLSIVFLASLAMAMPFISAAISAYDGSRTIAFCLYHKRWPTTRDLRRDWWRTAN